MKRTLLARDLAVAAILAWKSIALAQAPAAANADTAQGSAKIKFDSTIHDFGRVPENQIVQADFTFTNTGSAVLEVTDVKPSCGCTTLTNWDRRVEPGKTGVIPIRFNSANYNGPVTRFITVACNDPSATNLSLQIKATVWKAINVTPMTVYFALITSDPLTNVTRIAKITNGDEAQPLTLASPTSDRPFFKATIKTNQPGKEYDLEVGLVPPLNGSNLSGSITIATSSAKMPMLNIPVVVNIQPPVTPLPTQIVMPDGPLDGKRELGVYVRNNDKEPINVFEPSITLSNVQVQVHEFQKGRMYRVALSFPAGFELPKTGGRLTVKTSHPQVPLLEIPLLTKSALPPPKPVPYSPAPTNRPAVSRSQ